MGVMTQYFAQLLGLDVMSGLFQPRLTRQQLIDRESEIGGRIFGSAPQGVHRQFFNLDAKTWIWYEEQINEKGEVSSTTTRYEVHDNGVMKIQEGKPYYYIEGQELANLTRAIQAYYDQVSREVYRRDPATGELLRA